MRGVPRPWRTLFKSLFQVAGIIALYYVLPLASGGWIIGALLIVVLVVGLLPLSVIQAKKVLESSRPLASAIRAAVLLVTVLVIGFAGGYYELAHRTDGQIDAISTKTDSIYFTVTTLSTVGYGDIVPTGQWARALATAQMLVDLAFLALGVRLLTRAVEISRGRVEGPG
jgi:fumarate reductase subunit D